MNARELINIVLTEGSAADAADFVDPESMVMEALDVEFFNPYERVWQTVDEIDEEYFDDVENWDFRESNLEEDEFVEKAQLLEYSVINLKKIKAYMRKLKKGK